MAKYKHIKNAFLGGIFTSLLVILGTLSKFFDPLIIGLKEITLDRPLPGYYFPIFMLFGLIIPIFYRYKIRTKITDKSLIEAYLIFLFIQIINEITYVVFIGKYISVIIGFIFTMGRIVQIILVRRYLIDSQIKKLFDLLFLLWAANTFNIIFNRLVPLYINSR